MEVGDGVNSTCADCLAIIKYIRDRVATSKSMEEALEVIEKIIETLEQEHIAGVISEIRNICGIQIKSNIGFCLPVA